LHELRVENKLTQGQVAKSAGIDRKTVNRIENGHFSPNLDTLFRLCEAIGVKPEKVFVGIK
jgi:DNA-binding XRE family transcriptional regulator